MTKAAVIGAGSWGTAFAGILSENLDEVVLWAHSASTVASINETHKSDRYLTNYELPANVSAAAEFSEALAGAELIVLALPSTHLRSICAAIKPYVEAETPLVVLTKGIELESGLLMSEVVASELGNSERICALTGPNHAEEVSQGAFSAAVLAGQNAEVVEQVRNLVCTQTFRVYAGADERGVEICGATKNVIAIACGIVAGMGYGDNTLAVIMTRGIAEIGRMVTVLSGNPITCMGLAGMGDLVATCTSQHSRNRRFGEAFVKGTTLEEFETASHMVVEGARACKSVRKLAEDKGVDVPIVNAVYKLLYEGSSLDSVVSALSGRVPTEEFYGMNQTK